MSKTLQIDDLRIPTTKELKGEEIVVYLMKRFDYTREQALASVKRAHNFKLSN